MKKNTFNESVGRMRSLMERMNGKMTPYEAMLNEEKMIQEAIKKNRRQVTRDEIFDILDKADNSSVNLFASITYVNFAPIVKTLKSVDVNKVNSALSNHQDKSEEQWHKTLSDFAKSEKPSAKHNLSIIVVLRRVLQWHTKEQYDKDYAVYSDGLHNLRMGIGAAIERDGVLGDNHNQRTNVGGVTVNQTGNTARDINDVKTVNMTSTCYLVDNNTGNIITEIPEDVMRSLKNKKPYDLKIEKEVEEVISLKDITDEEKDALRQTYLNQKAELMKKWQPRNLLYDKILCICGSANGESFYYINDAIKTPIADKSDIYVKPEEMIEIAKEQLGESFDVIQGFAN
jgi:hypothetical protein